VWLVLRGLPWRALVVAYVAAFSASIFFPVGMLKFLGSPMVIEFGLGVLAYHLGRGRPGLGIFAMIIAGLVFTSLPKQLILAQAWMETYIGLGRVAFVGPLALMVVWGAAQFDCNSRLWRPLILLGDASYSIYLSHQLLMLAAGKILGHGLDPVLAAVAGVSVGLVSYVALERPMLRSLRRTGAASARPTAEPAIQEA
jgi:exopolysaccharide production protein ExoZ